MNLTSILTAIVALTPPDCNANGVADWQDIASATSTDAGNDGVPDECQDCTDGDGNGMPDSLEQGAGLIGQYWNDAIGTNGTFRQRVLVRIDPNVNFDWFGGSPDPSLPANRFSVRWTGTMTAPTTGPCTFYSRSDDGFRLWIDGMPIIDAWVAQSGTLWYSGTVDLVAGQRYAFRADYYEGGGDAKAYLEWQPSGLPRAVVPTSVFRAMTDLDGDGVPDLARDCDGDGISDGTELEAGTAFDCNENCLVDDCEPEVAVVSGYWRFEEDGQAVADSGPFGLSGTGSALARGAAVAVGVVPATAQANLRSTLIAPPTGSTGQAVVQDPQGRLASSGESFTVEAWVKLDSLANGSTAEERQVLVQRKPTNLGDRSADYIFCVQAGDYPQQGIQNFGSSGSRNITMLFGNGGAANASFWTVTSDLTISDNQWHYVAAIVDADRSEVTFIVDQRIDVVTFLSLGRVIVDAPLVIGAHTNTAGQFNQRLRGSVDELRICSGTVPVAALLQRAGTSDCNSSGQPDSCDIQQGAIDCDVNGVPDDCQIDCDRNGLADVCDLANGEADCNADGLLDSCQIAGNDCDGDGVLDSCQLAQGDCNDNGELDSCEVASDPSADCDGSGTPDVCQIEEETIYRTSDSFPEFGIRALGDHMAWLTSHRVVGGAGLIEAVEAMFVFLPEDHPVKVCLWSDPNNDGEPSDAQLLASVDGVAAPLTLLRRFDIPDTEIGADGTSFFVGAIVTTDSISTLFPGPLDSSGNALNRRSWIVGSDSPIDPNNLSANAAEFSTVEEALPFPGKWLLGAVAVARNGDCNDNQVLDGCDITAGTSSDADQSGRPDECEDCNSNGTLDSIDIASGASLDCQRDLVPDECQASGLGEDCNLDLVPDACQLEGNDCNTNAVLDSCDIAQATSPDLDGSGIPDECEDCNDNGALDSADVATGFSPDCQPDGIPDECQLGTPPTAVQYRVDDGTREGNYGVSGRSDMVWLNAFTVEPGGEWIGSVSVVIGNGFAGSPYEVLVWSDPDGDGIPADAQVLTRAPARVRDGNTSIFNDATIDPTYIGPVGTRFFAGVRYQDPYGNQAVIPADLGGPLNRSWIAVGQIDTVDVNNLSAAPVYGYLTQANTLLRANGFDGVLPFDCNRNQVPDACDLASGQGTDGNGDGIPDQCQGCRADLNGNGEVDGADLGIILVNWGGSSGLADLNGDGTIDGADLGIILVSWGPCI